MTKQERIQAIKKIILSKWEIAYKDDSVMDNLPSIECATAIEEAIGVYEIKVNDIVENHMWREKGGLAKTQESMVNTISTNKEVIKINAA